MSNTEQRLMLFIGSYAEPSNSGVYVYEFDRSKEELRLVDEVSGLKNPTFVNVDSTKGLLYAISENNTDPSGRIGEVVTYRIDPNTSKLTELSRVPSIKPSTSHIQRDHHSKYVAVSGYHGGNIGLIKLDNNGVPIQLVDEQQHEGHGPNPDRQEAPHPHSVQFSPDNRYAFVVDLGLDRIVAYELDQEQDRLVRVGEGITHPGAGPRHIAFHPRGHYLYSMNEVDSSLTVFNYDADTGGLQSKQTVPTLPDDFKGDNTTAEVVISNDGKYLYGSNRGHDSIVQYNIDSETGELTFVDRVSSEGGHPRHFTLTPDGDYLIAANRDSNNLAVFRVDAVTGKLQFTGHTATVSEPVCVQPVWM